MWGTDYLCCGFGWWWVFPVGFMIIMFVLCFFMMRRRGEFMRCGPFARTSSDLLWEGRSESAREILDKRFARGEIEKDEYVNKKRHLDSTES
jgi:putative membrane protein